ncbi:MAG: hypothetical protein Q8M02_14080 [Candidatus Didemnitutus sp.]|nr:hypothetical protein [Candidatus Didemnitutus sp.]
MRTTHTISQARAKLGRLADQVVQGKSVYLKRGDHLLRLERVTSKGTIPQRPIGYFTFDDELTPLANRAEPSFTPPDED